jgi:protein-L-isoaspartate(D-aspartate) O-methyltransferase
MIAMQPLQNDTYRHRGLRKELVRKLEEENYALVTQPDGSRKRVLTRTPITDRNVLEAINTVPRHLFFGEDTIFHENQAYEDIAFQIGEGQTISQPYTVARQSELLQVAPREKILEIGTGSGYQAAVLAQLGARVYTIERHRKLHERTKPLLEKLGYQLVKCFFGDGFEGLPMYAPFDKIIITAAVPELPKKLLKQLAVGGKMIIPFGSETKCIMLRITKVSEEQFATEEFGNFAFVPMLKGKVF